MFASWLADTRSLQTCDDLKPGQGKKKPALGVFLPLFRPWQWQGLTYPREKRKKMDLSEQATLHAIQVTGFLLVQSTRWQS